MLTMQFSPQCEKCSDKHRKYYNNSKTMAEVRMRDLSMINIGLNRDERLPIVEVRPFTKQVWRKAKSYPEYYQRHHSAPQAPKKESESGLPDPSQVSSSIGEGTCSRSRSHTCLSERSSKVKNSSKLSQEGKYFSNPPKGFATLCDRSRTTLDEIKSGDNHNIYYSLLPRARSDMNLSQEKNMQLQGKKCDEKVGKKSEFYQEPWQFYLNQRLMGAKQEDQQVAEDLILRMDHVTNIYKDGSIYDAFERSQTLPSIKIKPKVLRRRRKKNDSRTSSARSSAYQRGYQTCVQNSLELMSQNGKPIGVEDQLNRQLKNTLNYLRKNKCINGVSFDKSYQFQQKLERSATAGETLMYRRRINDDDDDKEFKGRPSTNITNVRKSKELNSRLKTMEISERNGNDNVHLGERGEVVNTLHCDSQDRMIDVVQESNSVVVNPVHIPTPEQTNMAEREQEEEVIGVGGLDIENNERETGYTKDKIQDGRQISKNDESKTDYEENSQTATGDCIENEDRSTLYSGKTVYITEKVESDSSQNNVDNMKSADCDIQSVSSASIDSLNDNETMINSVDKHS